MRKNLPDSLYNVPAVENWLGDMARRGLRCTGFAGEGGARFEEAAPEEVRYRLEPQLEKRPAEPDAEMRELYGAMGWEYVDSSAWNEFYLWRATRPDARELHTDPMAEDLAFAWVDRIQRRKLALCMGLDLLFLLLLGCMGWVEPYADWYSSGTQSVSLFLMAWSTGQYLMDRRALKALRKTLAAGVPTDHTAPYGARKRAVWVYIVLAALVIGLNAWDRGLSEPEELDMLPPELQAVTLDRLGAGTYGESVLHWRNLTLSDGWEIFQSGNVYPYFHSRAVVYDLRLDFLAGRLLREKAGSRGRGGQMERLEDARFDEVLYDRERNDDQTLLARKDGRVLYVRARVPEDLREHLDEFAGMLRENS